MSGGRLASNKDWSVGLGIRPCRLELNQGRARWGV